MSVPLFNSQNNLPIGSMFSAAFGNEELLFSLAAQLEKASPWIQRLMNMRKKLMEST